ncbi:hypothetical protein DM01DRAFT_1381290 [Hesseltinella vesiculosa]|uniref:RNA polymerase II subunit A C-terminal domain phosphatase n=1 Tax=Hesseltinella vesiculosa TaxID=101127 RepID=A0A1X2GRT2_9FUNG|nr:hypothetical protein DM01DRAFT_1381290 [Hesseltinella vesiculosa]
MDQEPPRKQRKKDTEPSAPDLKQPSTTPPSNSHTSDESPCRHEVMFGGLCANCGEDLAFTEQQSAQVNIRVDQPLLTATRQRAGQMEQENMTRLLEDRKLILVLDLDQTLIHTSSSLETKTWLNDEDIANQEIFKDIRQFVLPNAPTEYHLKLRPGVQKFLTELAGLYELHVYTMGTRDYAKAVVKELDPSGDLFRDRIMAREDNERLAHAQRSSEFTKSLDRVLTNNKSMVAVLDDRLDVWEYSHNLVHIRPYVFYKGVGDINSPFHLAKQQSVQAALASNQQDAPPAAETEEDAKKKDEKELEHKLEMELELAKEEALEKERDTGGKPFTVDDDRELYAKLEVFKDVHAGYYGQYDAMKSQGARSERGNIKLPNIVDHIYPFRVKLFGQLHLSFSSYNRPQGPHHYPDWNIARYYGARCDTRVSQDTTHFVTANINSAEAYNAKKQFPRIQIVHTSWVHECVAKGRVADDDAHSHVAEDNGKALDVDNPESTPLEDFDVDELEKELDKELDEDWKLENVDWDDADREVDEALTDDTGEPDDDRKSNSSSSADDDDDVDDLDDLLRDLDE